MAHVIRLRGPWQFELESGDALRRVVLQVPCNLAETFQPGFHGTARFLRRFNRPTGLQAGQRVWLTLEEEFETVKIVLNGQVVDQHSSQNGSIKLEIGDYLLPHNLLAVEVSVERGRVERFSGARIEIDARRAGG